MQNQRNESKKIVSMRIIQLVGEMKLLAFFKKWRRAKGDTISFIFIYS